MTLTHLLTSSFYSHILPEDFPLDLVFSLSVHPLLSGLTALGVLEDINTY